MINSPIGIFGGTFDPVHLGHLHLAKTIYQQVNLQKILFIPCFQSPLRDQSIASPLDRFQMLSLAIKDFPYFGINDYEIKQKTISYTYNTLQYLKEEIDPTTPLVLIIGIDAFNRFNEWLEWQKILELSHLVIVNRPDYEPTKNQDLKAILAQNQVFDPKDLQKKIAGLIYQTDIKPLPISATEIRSLIKARKDVSNLVTPRVLEYIKQHGLYQR